jgi:hypothetical protein
MVSATADAAVAVAVAVAAGAWPKRTVTVMKTIGGTENHCGHDDNRNPEHGGRHR